MTSTTLPADNTAVVVSQPPAKTETLENILITENTLVPDFPRLYEVLCKSGQQALANRMRVDIAMQIRRRVHATKRLRDLREATQEILDDIEILDTMLDPKAPCSLKRMMDKIEGLVNDSRVLCEDALMKDPI